MTVFSTLYALVFALIAGAAYVHATQFWGGNHWITFNTGLERFILSNQITTLSLGLIPLVGVAFIGTIRKYWGPVVISVLCMPVVAVSIMIMMFIMSD
jgi:hypothetical protein